MLVDVEGHGREPGDSGADVSRTVGWFTSITPVRLDAGSLSLAEVAAGGPAAGELVKRVKEQLRAVPGDGLGFGLLRYLNPRPRRVLAGCRSRRSGSTTSAATWPGPPRPARAARGQRRRAGYWACPGSGRRAGRRGRCRDAGGACAGGHRAGAGERGAGRSWWSRWPGRKGCWKPGEVAELADGVGGGAGRDRRARGRPGAGGHTPSDFPLAAVTRRRSRVEEVEKRVRVGAVAEIRPLSPLQEGLLFHAQYDVQGPDVYLVQQVLELAGPLDLAVLRGPGRPCWTATPTCGRASVRQAGLAGRCR